MPNITVADTYTKDHAGFGFLKASEEPRRLLFAGSSLGSSVTIKYKDDVGVFQIPENATVTTLPDDILISISKDLQIVVTGSPNFNVTFASFVSD